MSKWSDSSFYNSNFSVFQGSVRFRVQVPKMTDKSEFNLKGQMLNFVLPLTDAVSFVFVGKCFKEIWDDGLSNIEVNQHSSCKSVVI